MDKHSSTVTPTFHPALLLMQLTAGRWIDEGKPAGWAVLHAVATLSSKPAFNNQREQVKN